MKFCMPHWTKLREAIDVRGMTHLVSQSGMAAMESMVKDLTGQATLMDFDPLMSAHNMIVQNTMSIMGIDVLTQNEDGTDKCPICYLKAEHARTCTDPHCTADYEKWIDLAADGAKRYLDEQLVQATKG
jgi:hypothetical protein